MLIDRLFIRIRKTSVVIRARGFSVQQSLQQTPNFIRLQIQQVVASLEPFDAAVLLGFVVELVVRNGCPGLGVYFGCERTGSRRGSAEVRSGRIECRRSYAGYTGDVA